MELVFLKLCSSGEKFKKKLFASCSFYAEGKHKKNVSRNHPENDRRTLEQNNKHRLLHTDKSRPVMVAGWIAMSTMLRLWESSAPGEE